MFVRSSHGFAIEPTPPVSLSVIGVLAFLAACSSSSPSTLASDVGSGGDDGGSSDDASPGSGAESGSSSGNGSSGSSSGSGSSGSTGADGGAKPHDAGGGPPADCVSSRVDSGIPYTDAGVPLINDKTCDLKSNTSCVTLTGVARCIKKSATCSSNEVSFSCLQTSDCASGQLCCGVDSAMLVGSTCIAPGADGQCPATPQGAAQFCQTSCECENGEACIPQQCQVSGIIPANLTLCGLQNSKNYKCVTR